MGCGGVGGGGGGGSCGSCWRMVRVLMEPRLGFVRGTRTRGIHGIKFTAVQTVRY